MTLMDQNKEKIGEFNPKEEQLGSDTMLKFMSVCLMSREYSVNL